MRRTPAQLLGAAARLLVVPSRAGRARQSPSPWARLFVEPLEARDMAGNLAGGLALGVPLPDLLLGTPRVSAPDLPATDPAQSSPRPRATSGR
jgi:hypothetical protein